MNVAPRTARPARVVAVAALYVAFSVYLTSTFVGKHRFFNAYTPAQMQQLLRGEAKRPFALRVLVPWTVAAVVAPIDLDTRVEWSQTVFRDHPGIAVVASKHLHTDPEFFVEMLVVVGVLWLAALVFLYALRRLFRLLYADDDWPTDLCPVVVGVWLAIFFRHGTHYHYDFPTLAFATLCLVGLAERRWWLYYAALALGFLNKETLCVMTLAFAAYFAHRMPKRQLALHLGAQALLLGVLRVGVHLLADTGAPLGEDNAYVHQHVIRNFSGLWRDVTPWSFVEQAAGVLIIVLVFRRFAQKPLLLRRASVMALPLLAAYLYGGYWPEPRVFYEVVPVFALLAYENLFALLDRPLSPREGSSSDSLLPGWLAPYVWPMVAVGIAGLLLIAVVMAFAAKAAAQ